MSKAITGNLSATMDDGTVLEDSTDLGLAWKIAAHAHGSAWGAMPYREQTAEVAEVLAVLRAAHEGANPAKNFEAEQRHDFETEGRQEERPDSRCAVCGMSRSYSLHRGGGDR